jgi:hypothetical protein
VIAFNVGGVPEVLRHDVTGKLVGRGDDLGYAFAIEELVLDENLRMRMAEECRKTIVEKYSEKFQAEGYLELYRELMRGLPRIARKRDAYGFEVGNDFKVSALAPIGSRLKQICTDSLPAPLKKCLMMFEHRLTASEAELREANNYVERQQRTIQTLQEELVEQKGTLRERETTIFRQNQILGSTPMKMLRKLRLINQ